MSFRDGSYEESTLVCVTYPSYSSKYFATVCLAAVASDGTSRRIYPVPWEEYQSKRPTVGDVIRYKVRETDTARRESCKIHVGSLEVVNHEDPDHLYQEVSSRVRSLCDLQTQEEITLGFTEPEVNGLSVDESEEKLEEAKKYNNQLTLTGESLPVMAIPYHIRFRFECSPNCRSEHNIMCEDLRFCNKFWEFGQDSGIEGIESEYRSWFSELSDPVFMLGTHHRWGSWLIISILAKEMM